MRRNVIALCLALAFPSLTYAKEWRGIVPLRSTREDVVRLLGPEKKGTVSTYDAGAESAFILYAQGGCDRPGGKWNVPAGTVLEIRVTPRAAVRLSDLRIDKARYKREEAGLTSHVFYTNFEEGVSISVFGPEEEEVREVIYMPAAADEHLRCPAPAAERARRDAERERYLAGLGGRQETRPYRLLDSYGDLPSRSEKERLDNFSLSLRRHRDVVGYVVVYAGRRARPGEARRRAERAEAYLVNVQGVSAARVFTLDGGHREELTVELHLVPLGAPAPAVTPTVSPGEVEIITGRIVRNVRRGVPSSGSNKFRKS